MKKIVLFIVAFVVSLSAVGCSNDPVEEEVGPGNLTTISYAQYNEKKENGDNFLVILTMDNCGFCMELKEKIINPLLVDTPIQLYELNFSKETDEGYTEAVEGIQEELKNQTYGGEKGFQGTPTILVFQDKKIVEYFVGSNDLSVERFKELKNEYKLTLEK